MSEDDPDALERALRYLYTAGYDDIDHTEGDDLSISGGAKEDDSGNPGVEPQNTLSTDDADQSSNLSTIESSTAELARAAALSEADKVLDRVMVSALLNNVLVYALADKYNIQNLKELSKAKFEIRSSEEWQVQDILAVLPLVYETTPTTDRGLRDVMLNVCSSQMDRLVSNEKFREIVHNGAELAFDLLARTQSTCDEFKRENSSLHTSLRTVIELKAEIEWLGAETQTLQKVIPKYLTCRYCRAKLSLLVKRDSSSATEKDISLACARCQHPYTDY
ncbi:MAG: hypothetical protein Q9182_001404 [Xanthomendoza sp. 2 TL-2023]